MCADPISPSISRPDGYDTLPFPKRPMQETPSRHSQHAAGSPSDALRASTGARAPELIGVNRGAAFAILDALVSRTLPTLHLVDATYELFRAYFGAPPATAPD